MIDQISDTLISLQNPDGGWGASRGKQSNTEATSLALAALKATEVAASDRALRAALWLTARQNPNGGWRLNDAAPAGSWTTALAMIALSTFPEYRNQLLAAARWLLAQEGSKPGILAKLILFATGRSNINQLNRDLIGWSWVPNSFSWVEPTSYALIALKKFRTALADTNVKERIHEAEAMLYDRMCKGGGWNYGNSKVLDYALWPYPDITAVALIALQDRAGEAANQQSLRTLRKIAAEVNSGFASSWAAICLNVYHQATDDWQRRVEENFRRTGLLGETKTLALALLALTGNASPFRI